MAKRSQSPEKKAQILEAAATVLSQSGLQALSFENVARNAGISRQLLRYYYSDMDALMADMCDHLATVYQRMLVSGIVEIREVERLDFFLDFFFGLTEGHPMPPHLEAYDSMVAYSVGSDVVRDRMRTQYQTLGQVIVHELAITHPQLSPAACEELSYLFVSMMHAHWSFVSTLGYTADHGRLARRAIDQLIQSYLATPQPAALEKPWRRDG